MIRQWRRINVVPPWKKGAWLDHDGTDVQWESWGQDGSFERRIVYTYPTEGVGASKTSSYGMSMRHRPDGEIDQLTVHLRCSKLPEKVIVQSRSTEEKQEYYPAERKEGD